MNPLPSTLPVDAIQIVISYLRGIRAFDKQELATAIYNVVGYALGQALGGPVVMHSFHGTDHETAALLQAVVDHHGEEHSPKSAISIPWKALATALVQVLVKLLLSD